MNHVERFAYLLLAMIKGHEVKFKTGHTVVMEDEGPGFLMTKIEPCQEPQNWVMQIGEDGVYGLLVSHARNLKDEDVDMLRKKYRV